MVFNTSNTPITTLYKLLTSIITPRPIAWVSTISDDGINNLAPFSYFNLLGDDPPHVVFSTRRDNNTNKDTLNNVLANKQFVVNMVIESIIEAVNLSSKVVPSAIDEFELTGVTPIDSIAIKPKRVKESPIHLECELMHHYFLEGHQQGGACVLIGKILYIHINDELLLENDKINLDRYQPIARLAGSLYGKIGETFSLKRP